ncbi:MAG: hypothetical protein SFU98_13295 [Leptospiraceae bacterium]|nr:hypothetical protein [Leptospiraceae bacterium]
MKSKYKSIILYSPFLICFLILSPLFSEAVLLKDGKIVSGKILNKTEEGIIIVEDGIKKTIPSSLIRKITFKSRKELEEELEKGKSKKGNTNPETNLEEKNNSVQQIESIPSRTKILFYSALFPGLGQYKEGRKKASYYWFGGFATFLIATSVLYEEGISQRRIYEKSSSEFVNNALIFNSLGVLNSSNLNLYYLLETRNIGNERASMLSSANLVNSVSSLFLTFYLVNILDSYLFYPTEKKSISIKLIPELIPAASSQDSMAQTNFLSRHPYIQVQWEYRF